MHADERDIDATLVRRLLADQFPEWASLPLTDVHPRGTDNALFRLGDKMVVRLPRRERTMPALRKERRWLAALGPFLPLAVPIPLAGGSPAAGYPFEWSIYSWLPGEPATRERVVDGVQAATDLATFVSALRTIDPTDGPPPGEHNFFRGAPLRLRDAQMHEAIERVDSFDRAALTEIWAAALAAGEWTEPPVWIHGDLDARNVLAVDGRISGVIDWGGLAVGDPAADVMVAWKMLPADARETFRSRLGVNDATWFRARGWVLSQAVMVLAYYTEETNPTLVEEARRWLAEATAG